MPTARETFSQELSEQWRIMIDRLSEEHECHIRQCALEVRKRFDYYTLLYPQNAETWSRLCAAEILSLDLERELFACQTHEQLSVVLASRMSCTTAVVCEFREHLCGESCDDFGKCCGIVEAIEARYVADLFEREFQLIELWSMLEWLWCELLIAVRATASPYLGAWGEWRSAKLRAVMSEAALPF